MNYALSTTLHTTFDDAVERTRKALSEQGFGVLTEIDMKATLKAKLGEDMEDYLILGACNPPLAHRAMNADRQIGLLLPCNVVVRADVANQGSVIIDAMDPQVMVQVSEEPELRDVANDAATKLQAAIDSLSGVRRQPVDRILRVLRRTRLRTTDMTITLSLIFGAIIGVLLGLLGGGGSILAVPVLVYALGLDVAQAIPVSLIVIAVASAVGALPKVRANQVQWRLAGIFAAAGIPATFVGTAVGKHLPQHGDHARVRRGDDRRRDTDAARHR